VSTADDLLELILVAAERSKADCRTLWVDLNREQGSGGRRVYGVNLEPGETVWGDESDGRMAAILSLREKLLNRLKLRQLLLAEAVAILEGGASE
jgi:hypothetical protein